MARCEYGTPEELPNIFHRTEYEAGLDKAPDYRLTCFFADRNYRRRGVAAVALQGAVDLIAQAGAGVVEGDPQDTRAKRTSASFLYNGTRSLFEKAGLSFERTKGTKNCVMRRLRGADAGRPVARPTARTAAATATDRAAGYAAGQPHTIQPCSRPASARLADG